MDLVAQETLFPLPERNEVKEKLTTPIERFRHYMRVCDESGGLIPQNVLPDVLGVSRVRVSQLISGGRFDVAELFGQRFVTADSLARFVKEERKAGRPVKAPGSFKLAKVMYNGAKEMLKG